MATRPGLIELPGMKGEIRIAYDLSTSRVELEAKTISYVHLAQVLLAAVTQTIAMWAEEESGIIRPKGPKGKTNDGSEEETNSTNDDYHD